MSKIKCASPTFLFRNLCHDSFEAISHKLEEIGFEGIELYGMFDLSPQFIHKACNLEIVCDHIHYQEFVDETEKVLKSRSLLGARYITIDSIPSDRIPGTSLFPQTLKEIRRVAKACKDFGMQLLYHNHGYDLATKVDGIPMLDLILDNTDPEDLKYQPDLGWLALGGADPAAYLTKYKDRCPIIHLKDYYASSPILLESPFVLGEKRGGKQYNDFEFRPAGYGIMNFPSLMSLVLACKPEWITTDHDMSYERDTFEDMRMGLQYTRYLLQITADQKH